MPDASGTRSPRVNPPPLAPLVRSCPDRVTFVTSP